jgi:hypothetical protein
MKIERRGFIGTLLALPALKLAIPASVETRPQVVRFDPMLGDMLGLKTREVCNARYEFFLSDGRLDHNYCEIFRTPITWLGRKKPSAEQLQRLRWLTLEEHLRTIRITLDRGNRRCFYGSRHMQTYTGGRHMFGGGQGMLAVFRGRGLAFIEYPDGGGEWRSDVGFLPGEPV